MAAPSVQTSATSSTGAYGSSHSVTLPSSIASGDLLMILLAFRRQSTNKIVKIYPPAGWVSLTMYPPAGVTSVWIKKADGTESGSVTFGTGSTTLVTMAGIALRIDGWSGDLAAVEAAAWANSIGVNPDPPSISPSWSTTDDWLSLSFVGYFDDGATVVSYPDSQDNISSISSSSANQYSGAVCASQDQTSTATDDPGTYTLSQSEGWRATTIAIPATWTTDGYANIFGVNSSTEAVSTMSHSVSLPPGIKSGDLLLMAFVLDSGSGGAVSTPSGWTLEDQATNDALTVFSKTATGSEGSTVTVTTSSGYISIHCTILVRNWKTLTGGTIATGTGGSPDPPSLTHGHTLTETLYIALFGWDGSAIQAMNNVPTGYGKSALWDAAGSAMCGIAALLEDSASNNPGTFGTTASSGNWYANTYAIEYGAGGPNWAINIGDAWKEVGSAAMNVGDAWKELPSGALNVADAWKET